MAGRPERSTSCIRRRGRRPERSTRRGPTIPGRESPGALRLRVGADELRLITTLTHFGTAVDVTIAELRLEAFLPADEATATPDRVTGSRSCSRSTWFRQLRSG